MGTGRRVSCFGLIAALLGTCSGFWPVPVAAAALDYGAWRLTLNYTTALEFAHIDLTCASDRTCSGQGWAGRFPNAGQARISFTSTAVQLDGTYGPGHVSGSGTASAQWPNAKTATGKWSLSDYPGVFHPFSAVLTRAPNLGGPTLPPTLGGPTLVPTIQPTSPPPRPPSAQPTPTESGSVVWFRGGGSVTVEYGSLPEGAELRTDSNTRLTVRLPDGSKFDISPNSRFEPASLGTAAQSIELWGGVVHFIEDVRKSGYDQARHELLIKANRWRQRGIIIGSVRGTEFTGSLDQATDTVAFRVFSGQVVVSQAGVSQTYALNPGQELLMPGGFFADPPRAFDPSQVYRWWETPDPDNFAQVAGATGAAALVLAILVGLALTGLLRRRRAPVRLANDDRRN